MTTNEIKDMVLKRSCHNMQYGGIVIETGLTHKYALVITKKDWSWNKSIGWITFNYKRSIELDRPVVRSVNDVYDASGLLKTAFICNSWDEITCLIDDIAKFYTEK